jgi:Bifunctional DNA primase/polymerase, N-terminal
MELAMPALSDPARLALELAALGWHILPLSATSKRPLGNCPACRAQHGTTGHLAHACSCLADGGWCHGVRAATTDPARITAWWQREPAAVPGVAAGPSGLVLIDIDAHGGQHPPRLATGLLPGIDLAAEPIPTSAWDDPARFRDGRDTLILLARLRGGPRPWPAGPDHQPVTTATPSGGVHLWYKAPANGLRQALSDPHGRYGLAWQVDIKAGWSYGIAPGASTSKGTYQVRDGDLARPGRMPAWLAREVIRATTAVSPRPVTSPPSPRSGGPGRAAYLTTVIGRGAAQLAAMTDGRKCALSALAYQAGGLLAWSGLPREHIARQLTDAGAAAGLPPRVSARIVSRAIANGEARPIAPLGHRQQAV